MIFDAEWWNDAGLLAAGAALGLVSGAVGGVASSVAASFRETGRRRYENEAKRQEQGKAAARSALDRLTEMDIDWRSAPPSGAARAYKIDRTLIARSRADVSLISDKSVRDALADGVNALMTLGTRWKIGDIDDQYDEEYEEQISVLTGIRNTLADYLRDDPLDTTRTTQFANLKKRGQDAQDEYFTR